MESERHDDIARGMQLAQQLPEVMEGEADEYVGRIYADIHATLRVPFINFIFRMLANYPLYLDVAWSQYSPYMRANTLEGAADDLRSRALLEPVPDASSVDWAELGDLDEIHPFTDTIHYALPKLLLVATAFDEGLSSSTLEQHRTFRASTRIPLGVAQGMGRVQMVDPMETSGHLRALFDDLKQTHGHPGIASYYRALGNWPGFLQAVWERIKPLIDTTAYERHRHELVGQAAHAIAGIPLPSRRAAEAMGVGDEQLSDIQSILAMFRFKLIPDLLIDVSLIKAMLAGPEAARSSPFSATRQIS